MKIVLSLIFLFFVFCSFAQDSFNDRTLDSLILAQNKEQLIPKSISLVDAPEAYELPILVAISYYPELKGKKIIFKERKIKTTLNARPRFLSLVFSKKQNRTYVVRINKQLKDSIISLKNIPFNAQVGLFGHEFSHFADYQNRSLFGIIRRGFAYLSKKSKTSFEKEIDQKTIEHGLGWQLYEWSYYVQNQSNATTSYKEFKRTTYMTPTEIIAILENLSVQ